MIVVGGEMLVDLVPVRAAETAPDGGAGETAPDGAAGEAGPDLRPHLGGGPFNVAVAAGSVGADVAFLSCVSTDAYGRAGLARLAACGVDASLVQRSDAPTTLAVAQIGPGGMADYRFHWADAADRLVADPGPVGADVLCLGTLGMVFEPGATTYETVLHREAARGAVVALDPNVRPVAIGDAGAYRRRFRSWLPDVTVLKLSDADLRWLCADDDADPHVICRDRAARYGMAVVLTEGCDGVTAFTPAGHVTVAAHDVDVADTIGAGDTIMGVIAAEIDRRVAQGTTSELTTSTVIPDAAPGTTPAAAVRAWGPAEWEPVLRRAVAAAAITVSRPGAHPPTAAELDAGPAAATGRPARSGGR